MIAIAPSNSTIPGVTPLPHLITDHIDEIRTLCEKHRVKRLVVFGSAVKGTFDEDRSDVDFVVEFEAIDLDGWHSYFDLKFAVEELLQRPVDLVELTAVDNPYFRQSIELTQRELYAA